MSKCVSCGHEQASGRFCDNCGRMVTRIIINDPEPSEPADKGEERPAELRCRCGHVQRSGRFCDACGVMLNFYRAQADPDEVTARCPACGSRSPDPVCRNCGTKILGFPGQKE